MTSEIPPPTSTSPPSLPLPLTASLHLTSLPPDATHALSLANNPSSIPSSSTPPLPNFPSPSSSNPNSPLPDKITIRFQAVGSAPQLAQKTYKVGSGNRFESVVAFLGRKLGKGRGGGEDGRGGGGGVFCYVNSVFAPGLDEGVGGLWRCFKTDDQLIVAYSMTPAFG